MEMKSLLHQAGGVCREEKCANDAHLEVPRSRPFLHSSRPPPGPQDVASAPETAHAQATCAACVGQRRPPSQRCRCCRPPQPAHGRLPEASASIPLHTAVRASTAAAAPCGRVTRCTARKCFDAAFLLQRKHGSLISRTSMSSKKSMPKGWPVNLPCVRPSHNKMHLLTTVYSVSMRSSHLV